MENWEKCEYLEQYGDNVDKLLESIQTFQQEAEEINDKYVRLVAEFDNYRKRVTKEKADLQSFASADIVVGLLPTLDNLERALGANNDEGVMLVYKGLKTYLASKGLSEIDAINKMFDAELMEAVGNYPARANQAGKALQVLEKGYTLNGKVIRFAKVLVGNISFN
jgi:molecular chaperone GrpE